MFKISYFIYKQSWFKDHAKSSSHVWIPQMNLHIIDIVSNTFSYSCQFKKNSLWNIFSRIVQIIRPEGGGGGAKWYGQYESRLWFVPRSLLWTYIKATVFTSHLDTWMYDWINIGNIDIDKIIEWALQRSKCLRTFFL